MLAPLMLMGFCSLGGSLAAQSLNNGGSVSGSISPAGDVDSFSFFINAGEGFQIRIVDLSGTAFLPRMTLFDPGGGLVTSASGQVVAAISGIAAFSGTYSLEIRDSSSATPLQTGAYEVHFVRAPGANEGGSLPNGGSLSGNIGVGDLDSYTFSAVAGQNFQLRVADTSASALLPVMTVYDPGGAFFAAGSGQTVAAISAVATSSGTYTLVVADGSSSTPQQSGSYNVYYSRFPGANDSGALINGGLVQGSIDLGDLDTFSFSVNAGQNYQIRVADQSGSAFFPTMTIYDPIGALVTSGSGQVVGAISGVATATGTYTLLVRDGSSSTPQETGAYDVYFTRFPDADELGSLINGGVRSDTIDLGDLDTFSFFINAGENYQLRVADLSGSAFFPTMTIYDPIGAFVDSGSGQAVGAISAVATSTGTYTLLVRDGSSSTPQETGGYNVYYTRAPGANEGGLLLDGVARMDTIDLGDLDSYTFSAMSGEMAQITLTDTSGSGLFPIVRLYGMVGEFLAAASGQTTATLNYFIVADGIYTLVVADASSSTPAGVGTYTIVLDGSGAGPGGPVNMICPPELPGDPILSDIGGNPGLGPNINDAAEPFNFQLDCSMASASGLFVMEVWSSKNASPPVLNLGTLYLSGFKLLSIAGSHTQSVVTWFPAPAGFVLPADPALVGLPFTVQGFCGKYDPRGRLSNAITLTIGN